MHTVTLLEPFNYMWDIVANYSYNCLGAYLEILHKSSQLSRLQIKGYSPMEIRDEIETKIRKGEQFTIGPTNIDPFELSKKIQKRQFCSREHLWSLCFQHVG